MTYGMLDYERKIKIQDVRASPNLLTFQSIALLLCKDFVCWRYLEINMAVFVCMSIPVSLLHLRVKAFPDCWEFHMIKVKKRVVKDKEKDVTSTADFNLGPCLNTFANICPFATSFCLRQVT